MTGHRGMTERPENAALTDSELLARITEADEQLRQAQEHRDAMIVDAMIRGLNQSLIAETAGLNRRSLFKISDREFDRRKEAGQ